MYKEIDREFVIRTLKTYDVRTRELRKEMSAQYTLLNTQSLDDELLQATAYPIMIHRRLGIRWIAILMRSTRDT